MIKRASAYTLAALLLLAGSSVAQIEGGAATSESGGPPPGMPREGGANASNPLAAVNSADLKWTYSRLEDPNSSRANLYWIKGSQTLARWAKLSYEINYQETNITGSSQSDWQSVSLKPIFFVKQGKLGSGRYRLATGFEAIFDADNCDRGIGTCTDLFSPLFGFAYMAKGGTTIVPLVQHFVELSGRDTSITGFRVIVIQRLPNQYWTKLDTIVPHDWNLDQTSGTAEVELGRMLNPRFGIYASALAGLGGHSRIDRGGSLNLRFTF